ncbi:hypothetical protein PGB90_000379 [Kerria lacca]
MNLLKIFTYGGIIEVFVVPHILPCIVGLIPDHIIDMIQFGISIVSGLFPRVTVNIQSEVFLKMWNDSDSKNDFEPLTRSTGSSNYEQVSSERKTSSSDSSCTEPECPQKSEKNITSQSTTSKPSHDTELKYEQTPDRKDFTSPYKCKNIKSTTNNLIFNKHSQQTRTLNRNESKLNLFKTGLLNDNQTKEQWTNQRTRRENTNEKSSYDIFLQKSRLNSSNISLRNDTFARSCSAEYQVKSMNTNEKVTDMSRYSSNPCKNCTIECLAAEESKYPAFCKSCSVEYSTSLHPEPKFVENEDDTSSNSVNMETTESFEITTMTKPTHESNWKSNDEMLNDYSLTNELFSKNPMMNTNIVDDIQKPVYFGSNFQNL